MKRCLILSLFILSLTITSTAQAQSLLVPGDMNADNDVDLFDTVAVINVVLGRSPIVNDADINQDTDVDIRDVVLCANLAVGNPAVAHSDPLLIPNAAGQVTIRGGNFDPVPGNNVVVINGSPATVQSVTTINGRVVSLLVNVQGGTTSGGIMVTSGGVTALNSPPLTVAGAVFSIDDVTVDEGNGTATLTIDTGFGQGRVPNDFRITVNTTDGSALSTGAGIAGDDFTAISNQQVTISSGGRSTVQVMIPINDDMINEGTESFSLVLSSPEVDTGGGFVADPNSTLLDSTGLVTITDNDDSNISIDDVMVAEGDSGTTTLDFTISVDKAASTDIRLMATTMDGTATTADDDYVMASQTLTIAAGMTSTSFMVTVNGDTTDEADETVLVNLTTPAGGLGGQPVTMIADSLGVGTITNDEAPPPASYSINDMTVNESARTATLTIDSGLSQPLLADYRITVNTMDNSAVSTGVGVASNDYKNISNQMVTFTQGGASTAQVMVSIGDDMINEVTEQFTVVLSNPEINTGAGFVSDTNSMITDGTGVVTITDNDDSHISIDDVSIAEGNTGTAMLTFTVSVDKAASTNITVMAATADGTATTADSDYVANTGTVTIPAGMTSANFAVVVNGDPFFETDETVLVNLSTPAGNPTTAIIDNQGIGTITNDDPQGADYSINDMTVNESAGTATLTIDSGFGQGGPSTNFRITVNTMDNSALSTGVGVGGSDYVNINNQLVTFTQGGASTAQVMITINDDMINEDSESFNVVLSNPEVNLGAGFNADPNSMITDSTGVVTITDNDDSNISIDDPSVAEGNTGTVMLTFTVSVDKAASADITVMAATADGTATTADSDYVANTGTVTITAGQTSASFTVMVNGDTSNELDETVLVNLTAPAGGLGGNPATAISDNQGSGTITNDDNLLFGAKTDFTAGAAPRSTASVDLNGDGVLDLIVPNATSNNVSVLLGIGNGTFGAKTDFPVAANPRFAKAADFNGDGNLDVVVPTAGSDIVSILIGDGNGSFGAAMNTSIGDGPFSVDTGDLNKDGNVDFVIANLNADTISVFLGNGNGTFQTRTDFTAGDAPASVKLADFNNDGQLDVVAANLSSNTISVFLGTGNGSLGAKTDFTAGAGSFFVTTSDLNSDGNIDIITANSNANNVSVFLGVGNGSFNAKTDVPAGDRPFAVVAADINNDGKLDLVMANQNTDQATVILGVGDGTFAGLTNYTVGDGPFGVTVADFNRDGQLDIVTANTNSNDVSVLLNLGLPSSGTFGAKTDFTTGTQPSSVFSGDVNGDGILDLVVANSAVDTVSVLLGIGNGTFGPKNDFPAGDQAFNLKLADFNCDGNLDIVTANFSSNDLSVLLGVGDGTFGVKTDLPAGMSPVSVNTADVNGDGNVDLLSANQDSNSVSIFLGNGDGTFLAKNDFTVGTGPLTVITADLNSDGNLDIVTVNFLSNNASILLGVGNGTFSAKTDFATGAAPYSVVSADFNGDGKLDIASANFNDNNASILLGVGDGTFGTKADIAAGSNPFSIATADLNRDGKFDLVVANSQSDNLSIFIGVGDGTFGAKTDLPAGDLPASLAIADFNLDGNLDLATPNASSDTISVLLGQP